MQEFLPAPGDPVVAALHDAEAHYREVHQQLEEQSVQARRELARAREEVQELNQMLVALQAQVELEHRRVVHEREIADTLAGALKDIHRAFFSGNVYDLILKTCLTLTGATRGLYITADSGREAMRVRAAIEVSDYPSSAPSAFITALCRRVLQSEAVFTGDDAGQLPDQPAEGEAFRNFVAAPVVLRGNLSGVVIVADKAGGEFDQQDADVLLSVGAQAAVAIENARLQGEVHEAYLSVVSMLAEAMAARSPRVERQQDLTSRRARAIGERLGMSEVEQSVVYYAGLLYDVGNIGVSDGVLNKPGPLLDAERELIRAHVQIGPDILRTAPVLEPVAQIVRHHHEWYDGSGYPDGLQGEAIPLAARVVAVVSAYSAMLAKRSYRPALTEEEAREQLRRGAGTQFDPRVVDALVALLESGDVYASNTEENHPILLSNVSAHGDE